MGAVGDLAWSLYSSSRPHLLCVLLLLLFPLCIIMIYLYLSLRLILRGSLSCSSTNTCIVTSTWTSLIPSSASFSHLTSDYLAGTLSYPAVDGLYKENRTSTRYFAFTTYRLEKLEEVTSFRTWTLPINLQPFNYFFSFLSFICLLSYTYNNSTLF